MERRRYQGFQRSRLSETRVNSGADVVYEGPRNWMNLLEFLVKQTERPLKSDFIVKLETNFAERELERMQDSLYARNDPFIERLIVGPLEQVVIIKPIK